MPGIQAMKMRIAPQLSVANSIDTRDGKNAVPTKIEYHKIPCTATEF